MYAEVKRIPKGRVATYEEIARRAGVPRGARAVGNALNNNIFSDVPCHRVVRGDGAVGGYAGGAAQKINMLIREGVDIKNGYIDIDQFPSPLSFPRRRESRELKYRKWGNLLYIPRYKR